MPTIKELLEKHLNKDCITVIQTFLNVDINKDIYPHIRQQQYIADYYEKKYGLNKNICYID